MNAEFIGNCFKTNKTLNVRWAVLYLGKYKVERALPLLFEHLDYCYTTCPVLAEAYPAVHALMDYGAPAGHIALQKMAAEINIRRLKLLGAVVLGIEGCGRRAKADFECGGISAERAANPHHARARQH